MTHKEQKLDDLRCNLRNAADELILAIETAPNEKEKKKIRKFQTKLEKLYDSVNEYLSYDIMD